MYFDFFESPIGILKISANSYLINSVVLVKAADLECQSNFLTDLCKQQLSEYFYQGRKNFDIPFAQEGTSFQKLVWGQLSEIPFGETWAYSDVAMSVGRPKAQRAVGGANNKNKLPIIVPCHRVVGKNGSLVGFGLGTKAKAWLLAHEKKVLSSVSS